MTILQPVTFSPDLAWLVLALGGAVSLGTGWLLRLRGQMQAARPLLILGLVLIGALVAYSLIVTWLTAGPPIPGE